MAVFIDSAGRLHHGQDRSLALNCPHCQVLAHITPVSVPDYNQLQQHKPGQVGLVYRCEACNAPIFLRFQVKLYAGSRVELAPNFVELERPREKFSSAYLPERAESLFKEALACFSSACYNAFASMCRRTAQAAFADLGEEGKLQMFDELSAIRRMAELDDDSFRIARQVLFESDGRGESNLPELDSYQAGVLLEVVKDLLYQAYVRRGRLQQAMMVRRYFAEENSSKITPLERARS